MKKLCPVCEHQIRDGDEIAAVVISRYNELPSKVAYSIEKPTQCLSMVHLKCNEFYLRECASEDD